ncbi:MAG: RidA family protein [Lachnospiraceae bacterium]|nr:RidA family protein [Lachnospiraceae bacterium]
MKQIVNSDKAPAAIGPYSQAIEANGFVLVSGQLPIVPSTGQFPSQDVQDQTKASLENIRAILKEAGLGLEHVVKTTVYLADIKDFGPMNEIYGQYFQAPYPARAAFAVAGLPKGAKVEIEVIAAK